jgi:hypothetical protein
MLKLIGDHAIMIRIEPDRLRAFRPCLRSIAFAIIRLGAPEMGTETRRLPGDLGV